MTKHMGRVRWFNTTKGFGFLIEEGDDRDIFLHFTSIQVPGYKSLEPGQRVVFTLRNGPRGPVAHDVVPVEDEV